MSEQSLSHSKAARHTAALSLHDHRREHIDVAMYWPRALASIAKYDSRCTACVRTASATARTTGAIAVRYAPIDPLVLAIARRSGRLIRMITDARAILRSGLRAVKPRNRVPARTRHATRRDRHRRTAEDVVANALDAGSVIRPGSIRQHRLATDSCASLRRYRMKTWRSFAERCRRCCPSRQHSRMTRSCSAPDKRVPRLSTGYVHRLRGAERYSVLRRTWQHRLKRVAGWVRFPSWRFG